MTPHTPTAPRLSAGPDFGLETVEASGTHVVLVAGEVDPATAPLLEEELLRLAGLGAPSVVADLALCAYVDSSGLRALVRGLRALEEAGGSLAVCCPGKLARVFALSGLAEALGVCGADRRGRP